MASGKTVILVAGPTAVGKTALSISLAEYYGASIISADSRQCYRELTIGVARPSVDQLARVPHYFIATHSVTEQVNAATFEAYALDKAKTLFEKEDILLLTGGTGLYIKAFCEGLDLMPGIPEPVRTAVREGYRTQGLAWLQQEVGERDPEWYAGGETQNPHRLMRVLEVALVTGRSIRDFQGGVVVPRNFNVIKIGLDLPRPLLYDRINERVDQMMDMGLVEEVRGVLPFRKYNALETVGYKELLEYFDGSITLSVAVDRIKQHTRHYAKRQVTWFRKDADMAWFLPGEPEKVLEYIQGQLANASR